MSEAEKFMDNYPAENENVNLNGLNAFDFSANATDNQRNKGDFANVNISTQIAQNKPNPRKVVRITIFYDDNSYETFTPEKK